LISNYDYLYGGYRIKTGHTSKRKREAENIEKGIKRLPARRYNAFGSRIMNRKKTAGETLLSQKSVTIVQTDRGSSPNP
jgi:hypothetical protein